MAGVGSSVLITPNSPRKHSIAITTPLTSE